MIVLFFQLKSVAIVNRGNNSENLLNQYPSGFGLGHSIDIINKFYSVVNKVIEDNVPNKSSHPSAYLEWYTGELIKLISDKKAMHITWKEQIALKRQNKQFYAGNLEISYKLQFNELRSKCFRLSRELYVKCMAEVENRIQHHVKSFWLFVNKAKKSTALPDFMYLRVQISEEVPAI